MTTTQQKNGANLVLETLAQLGVDSVFGYPGGTIMPIYDALYDSPIKHYLCRHEQGASFMAQGFARASGKVGVCFATSGPGATNLITGLADAMGDSVAMVAITGQVSTQAMGSDAFQEVDILGLSLACTKHCFQVREVSEIAPILRQAFDIAQSGRPGPVLVDIPKDIQLAPLTSPLSVVDSQPAPQSPPANVGSALALLSQCKKPIAYIGGGVGMANAVAELRDFLDVTQMPCVSTLKGLGAVAENYADHLGMLGMHGTKAANLAVQQCDLLIAIGARFDDRVTGKLAKFAPNAKVIHFDIDAAEVNKRRAVQAAVMGELKTNLPALAMPLAINDWRQHCRQMQRDFAWDYNSPNPGIFAPALLNQLSEMKPADSVVTTDVGQHQMWAAQHMRFSHPSNFLTSGGLGTMGFGLPAAIGAQVSRPKDPVIAVSGDGSFMMNVQELSTIKRYQLPVKIVLIDNTKLGMVRQWQQLFFDGRYSETDLSDNPDFVLLAKAFDIPGRCIDKPEQVSEALLEMINHQGPYLLHVRIDAKENVWPLVPPETANDEMLESL